MPGFQEKNQQEMKVLQINLDRGREALDLMSKTAREEQCDLCLIQEPNKKRTEDWYGHEDAKIKVLNQSHVVAKKGTGLGHTFFDIDQIRFISCYISPNSTIEELEQWLDELSYTIRGRGNKEIILGGDFNSKSWGWGETRQDRRGLRVSEWIWAENLVILNTGNVPTFVRGVQKSIIDLTLGTERIATKVENWQVLDDVETLSLHQYITFEIREAGLDFHRGEELQFKGWKVKSLNIDKLREIVREADITNETNLTQEVSRACESTMKKKGFEKKKEVYWWTNTIAQLRKNSNQSRRRVTRCRRRNAGSEECKRLEALYMGCKGDLKKEIRKSKDRCWKELCAELERDVWGSAYKIVTKKFGLKLPTLPPQVRSETIDRLFPTHRQVTWSRRDIPEGEIEEFTLDELLEARINLAVNKAPGPDHIPSKVVREVVLEIPDTVLNVLNSLLKTLHFPDLWKEARVVLIEKASKNIGAP